uniref:Uncharacterized protein n=1 Tax=Setaria italica TaxID=4555 RepID=K3Z2R2_SETIT
MDSAAVQKVDLFGNLRIYAYFQLPEAFRRCYALPRLWVPRYPPQAFPLLNLAINVKAMPSKVLLNGRILSTSMNAKS